MRTSERFGQKKLSSRVSEEFKQMKAGSIVKGWWASMQKDIVTHLPC